MEINAQKRGPKLYAALSGELDQHSADPTAAAPEELGPLPTASKLLLGSLAAVWLSMGAYVGCGALKKRRQKQNTH